MAEQTKIDPAEAPLLQQTVLAQFGLFALQSQSLDEILQEACRLVCMGLKADHAKVMELSEDGNTFLVRAGVHWKPDLVGQHREQRIAQKSDGFTLATGLPTIAPNLDEETRFEVPQFVKDHGVKAFVNVIIVGPQGKAPYGILEVDNDTPRQFQQSDVDFLLTYANLIAAAVDRQRLDQQLHRIALARERLLRELQHRIKNSLQMITSLVAMKRRRAASPDTRAELQSIESRIETLRILHDKLYAAGETDQIGLAVYLAELSGGLIKFHSGLNNKVRLRTDLNGIMAASELAIPIGLIVNEFITNSLKHAFGNGQGTIGIELISWEEHARVTLWDDGSGFIDSGSQTGTGLNLIRGLAAQIGTTATWKNGPGTRLQVDLRIAPGASLSSSQRF